MSERRTWLVQVDDKPCRLEGCRDLEYPDHWWVPAIGKLIPESELRPAPPSPRSKRKLNETPQYRGIGEGPVARAVQQVFEWVFFGALWVFGNVLDAIGSALSRRRGGDAQSPCRTGTSERADG